MSSDIQIKSSILSQKNAIKNMNEKHQNELEKIRLAHSKRKSTLQAANREQLISEKLRGQKAVMDQAQRQEELLEKMKGSLEEVKTKTQKQKVGISKNLESEINRIKGRHEQEVAQTKATQEMVLEELNQKANIELQKLQRQIDGKSVDLKQSARLEHENIKESAQNQAALSKQSFLIKKNANEDKYQSALLRQEKNQSKILSDKEKKHQSAIANRDKTYQKELSQLKQDSKKQKIMTKALFEKKYSEMTQKNEKRLGELKARKEEIIQGLRNEITKAYKLDVGRSNDPFYTTSTLDPKVEEIDGRYQISMKMDKKDAENVFINGYKRDISISFNRRFENTRTSENATEKVNKVETLTRNFKVEKIVDMNQVQKSYQDGTLIFSVPIA